MIWNIIVKCELYVLVFIYNFFGNPYCNFLCIFLIEFSFRILHFLLTYNTVDILHGYLFSLCTHLCIESAENLIY